MTTCILFLLLAGVVSEVNEFKPFCPGDVATYKCSSSERNFWRITTPQGYLFSTQLSIVRHRVGDIKSGHFETSLVTIEVITINSTSIETVLTIGNATLFAGTTVICNEDSLTTEVEIVCKLKKARKRLLNSTIKLTKMKHNSTVSDNIH